MSTALIACASDLRFSFGRAAAPLVRLAADAGFDGVTIGRGCGLADVAPLAVAALAAGLAVPLAAAPLQDGFLGPDRRLPYLAALGDGDERRAAVAAFGKTLDVVGTFGIRLLSVDLGEVSLAVPRDVVARRFARRELDEDEPGGPAWRRVRAQRKSLSGEVLDACRYAIDRVLPIVERRDAVMALAIAKDPWGIPSPREAAALLDEYANGPFGVVWDEAGMQVLRVLGIGPSAERATALAKATRVLWANEAVGLETGYLPGLGDPDGPTAAGGEDPPARASGLASGVAADVPTVVTGREDSSADEVGRARELTARRAD